MIGRGARLSPGKDHCKIVEFTDNDFDVCDLECLVNSLNRRIKNKDGERLTEYASRVEKELLEGSSETVVQTQQVYKKDS